MRNSRLVNRDLKKLQKTLKEKTDKEVESLIQLLSLPDFDVPEFFQTLMRSSKQEEVLGRIPKEKQIDFFSRNFTNFIETQDQISHLKLPELEQIPKAKQFKFQEKQESIDLEDADESSVLEIVDSFGAVVLEKNTNQIIRILQIINQMKQHSRYQKYFHVFSINKLFRQSYETFLETCEDRQVLLKVGEMEVALRKFLKQKTADFISKIRAEVHIDNTARGMKKVMEKLTLFIETTIRQSKQQFPVERVPNSPEIQIAIPKFLADLSKQFYQTIEPCIYEKQQLSQVLESLEILIESSTQLESKGINLSNQFKDLICHDLPMHMNRIIEVAVEAFDDILKQDNCLYEFKYFDGLGTLGLEMQLLSPIGQGEYGKKCCSKKGILLINAFVIILEQLCDQKWAFLQENVIGQLFDKVSSPIYDSSWHYWDYYQLFYFFDRMRFGKIKHKKLFHDQDVPLPLKEKMAAANKFSLDCWQSFETTLTNRFWVDFLSKIPHRIWEARKYFEEKAEQLQKPTIFGMQLCFQFESFIKNIQFRLAKQQFEYMIIRFYEYIFYVIEYVVYYEYHSKGTKQKIFSLFQRSDKIFKKVKNFSIEELELVKDKKIQTIKKFSKAGVKNIALDMYFFTQAFKIITQYQKVNCVSFVQKIAQIQSKQHKTDVVSVSKDQFTKYVDSCIKVYRDEPEKIKQYMEKKKKQASN